MGLGKDGREIYREGTHCGRVKDGRTKNETMSHDSPILKHIVPVPIEVLQREQAELRSRWLHDYDLCSKFLIMFT